MPLVPPPPKKTGVLSSPMLRTILIGTVLMCATIAGVGTLAGRYDMIQSSNKENSIIFRLDKLSGAVSMCTSVGCRLLEDRAGE